MVIVGLKLLNWYVPVPVTPTEIEVERSHGGPSPVALPLVILTV